MNFKGSQLEIPAYETSFTCLNDPMRVACV